MLREAREQMKGKGLPPIDHRVLAELAGYVCVFKHRSFREDKTPDPESLYVTVINQRMGIPKETDVAAPTPNEAWQTFLTMIWQPDRNSAQCQEVLLGASLQDPAELGRQIQAELFDLNAPISGEAAEEDEVSEGKQFTYEQVAAIATMPNTAKLRAVRGCEFFRKAVTKLQKALEDKATQQEPGEDGTLQSLFGQPVTKSEES